MNVVPAFVGRAGYFPGFLASFHHLLAGLLRTVDVHLAHPVQHLFPGSLAHRRALPLDQVAHHCPPDSARSSASFMLSSMALLYHLRHIQPYLSADPLELAANVFAAISVCAFIAAIDPLSCSPCPGRMPPPPGRGGRRFAARPWAPVLLLQLSFRLFRPSPMMEISALLGAAHHRRPVHLLSPLARLHRDRAARAGSAHHSPPGHALRLCPRNPVGAAGDRFVFLGYRVFHFVPHLRPRRPAHRPLILFVVVVLFLRLRVARPLSLVDRPALLPRGLFRRPGSCSSFPNKRAPSPKPSLCCGPSPSASAKRCMWSANLVPAAPRASLSICSTPRGFLRTCEIVSLETIPRPSAL